MLSDGPGAAAVGVLGEAGWWRRCIGHLAERRRRCLSRQVKGWRDRGALLDADAVSEEAVPMSGEWAAEVGLAGHGEGVAGAAVSGMGGGAEAAQGQLDVDRARCGRRGRSAVGQPYLLSGQGRRASAAHPAVARDDEVGKGRDFHQEDCAPRGTLRGPLQQRWPPLLVCMREEYRRGPWRGRWQRSCSRPRWERRAPRDPWGPQGWWRSTRKCGSGQTGSARLGQRMWRPGLFADHVPRGQAM